MACSKWQKAYLRLVTPPPLALCRRCSRKETSKDGTANLAFWNGAVRCGKPQMKKLNVLRILRRPRVLLSAMSSSGTSSGRKRGAHRGLTEGAPREPHRNGTRGWDARELPRGRLRSLIFLAPNSVSPIRLGEHSPHTRACCRRTVLPPDRFDRILLLQTPTRRASCRRTS